MSCLKNGEYYKFNIPNYEQPEEFINRCITSMPLAGLSEEEKMIISLAKEIKNPSDKHQYIDDITNKYGIELSAIVNLFAKTEQWENYVAPIEQWIKNSYSNIKEDIADSQ